jgi:REP element-mobilizing transposase RayT
MSVHLPTQKTGIYFITFTCHDWLPLIDLTNSYDLLYKWFAILGQNKHSLPGFVLMPNHVHLLLHYVYSGQSLNTIIGNGKRFLAYDIIRRLQLSGQQDVLNTLAAAVQYKDRQKGQKHVAWKDSFDWKLCRTEKFITQKLQYIHNNPLSGRWKLAESITQYPHSSASYYISGKHNNFAVRDYREVIVLEGDF